MDEFFRIITPITYWLLAIIWIYIFIFYIRKIRSKRLDNKLMKLLLFILAIDAFRTLFESIYFGAWYTSLSGLIPIEIFNYLAQPQIVFIPKIINLIVAALILVLIINRWLPSEIIQKEELKALVEKQISELSETNKKLIQAKIKAEESEAKYQSLYDNAPDMYVSVSSHDASILQCNKTLLHKTGYSGNELIGSSIFKIYHDDCMEDVKKAFQQFIEKGIVKDKELILKRKDGSKIEVSLNVNSVKDDSGNILHSVSSWRDITERKKSEEELRKYRENLEELVKERTEKLEKSLKDLEQMNELFVGREFRIKELKDEIKELEKRIEN
jgi:PAS domain S-box-containing protein